MLVRGRYEYDLNIEANLNAIALMEPIARDIAEMSLEEKSRFRLPPGLGGQTTSIYQRIIKKVYDKERGFEIIDLLHNNPAHVLPIVLNRLKKKDAEWKKAQVRLLYKVRIDISDIVLLTPTLYILLYRFILPSHCLLSAFSVNGTNSGEKPMQRTFTERWTIKAQRSRVMTDE